MGQKTTVDSLPPEQRDFVIALCTKHKTNRFISAEFEKEFGKPLPKSSLHYWRQTTGDEMVERYGIQRMMVKTFVGELAAKGIDVNEDKYKQLISDLEEHLLAQTADLISKDPLKLLEARQYDESMRIKREVIALNQKKLDFDIQKYEREASVRTDRLQIALDVWKFELFWLNENEPHLAEGMTRVAPQILPAIEGYIDEQAQAA